MTKKLDELLKKRAQIEAEIENFQRIENRKSEILLWPEFQKIAELPDEILKSALSKIAQENLSTG